MPGRKSRRANQDQDLEELHSSILASGSPRNNVAAPPSFDMNALVEALETRTTRTRPFKTPQYSGETDIDIFITQFQDVAQANRWTDDESRLHLRLSLTSKATDCGIGGSVQEIFESLKSRFGMSTRQAKDRLRSIQLKPGQGLQELSVEITKIIQTAYPNLDHGDRREMALDTFSRATGNVALQRHLLAVDSNNMAEVVRISEEFLQIGKDKVPRLTTISEEPSAIKEMSQALQAMQGLMTQQMEFMKNLTQRSSNRFDRKPLECYECKGPHLKRNCPLINQKQNDEKVSGNASGPVV